METILFVVMLPQEQSRFILHFRQLQFAHVNPAQIPYLQFGRTLTIIDS